jgi:hypothetical protein
MQPAKAVTASDVPKTRKVAQVKEVSDDFSEEGFRKVGGSKRDDKDIVAQLLGDATQANVMQKLSEVLLARGKKVTFLNTHFQLCT